MSEYKYQIEKNIPIPAGKRENQTSLYPFKEMKVGDSFSIGVIEGSKGDSDVAMRKVGNAARNWKNKVGRTEWKFRVRKMEDNSVRIWRVA